MATNKVVYNGRTLIDLTADTVVADKLASGYTAHDKSGALITGTMSGGGGIVIPTPTAGNYPVLIDHNCYRVARTSLGDTGLTITIPVTGSYRIRWSAYRYNNSGTWGTRLYVNGSAVGTENTSWTNTYNQSNSIDLSLNKGDVLKVYGRSRSTSYYISVSDLSASVADNGFSQL